MTMCLVMCLAISGASLRTKTTSADAESYFKMANGASIDIIGNGDYGIRWKIFVSEKFVDDIKTTYRENVKIEFHTIIGPAVSDATTLTKSYADTNGYKDCLCTAETAFKGGEFTYYAYLRYSNLSENLLSEAFDFNLTARAYVIINDNPETIAYADAPDTTRSMKGVASYMLANGLYRVFDVDKDALETYAGSAISEETTVLGTADCGWYSLLDGEGKITLSGLGNGEYQAYIGAKKVADKVIVNSAEPVEFTIKDAPKFLGDTTELVVGKSYDLTILGSDGAVYAQPFKYATKVIDEAKDFAVFTMETNTDKFDGYYMLANDIDATGYTHKVYNHTSSNSGDIGMYYGLTGTFDGNGYTISNMNMTSRNGLFGNVYNGKIINVAFKNTTMYAGRLTGFFAYGIQGENARIENVYMDLNYTGSEFWTGALAVDIRSAVNISNTVLNVVYNGGSQKYYGSIGGYTASEHSDYKPTFDNVYVISTTPLFVNATEGYATDASNRTNIAGYSVFLCQST